MKRITIKLPSSGKWGISFGKGSRKRNSANTIWRAVERHFQGYAKEEKVVVSIKDSKDTINETLGSNNPEYLLYTTGCFLEEFLSDATLGKIEKKYLNHDK